MRPIDVTVEDPNIQRSFSERQANEFASTLVKRIDESTRITKDNLEKSRDRMKLIFDNTISVKIEKRK